MGRPFRIRVSTPQRSLHNLRYRLALVLFTFIVIKQHHLFFKYRNALAAKYSPTAFSGFVEQQPWALDEGNAHFEDQLVADRAAWNPLREGWEGKTFSYQDSVIKTFTPDRSPFRNCAPGSAHERWPTEIPASLFYGGYDNGFNSLHDGFLPVKAFFMAATSTNQAEWHLVTPLVKGGSLQDLAIKIQKQKRCYRDVDVQYRPAFTGLLNSIRTLHEAGYCHDDIKPANILVSDDAHWILGDLGNMREVTHAYHTSVLWSENSQLAGCRENDVLRAFKTYLRFLHDAAVDADVFNNDFLKKQHSLSYLFWSVTANTTHLSAEGLRARLAAVEGSHQHDNNTCSDVVSEAVPSATWLGVLSQRWGRHYAVKQALQTRIGEKSARWWALTWIFGVPVSTVCGV